MDMCHFGLVGSGNLNPSNLRATHMAAATLRPPLTPSSASLGPPPHHLQLLPPLGGQVEGLVRGTLSVALDLSAFAAVALGFPLHLTAPSQGTFLATGPPGDPSWGRLMDWVTCRLGNRRLGPWVSSMAKNAMRRGSCTPVGKAFGMPDTRWTSRALRKKAVPLLNGTALSTQGSGNPELLEGTKRKCDPSSAS